MKNYKELKEFLIKCSDSYYKDSISLISDYEFDMKLKELEAIEKEQGYADKDSPTQKPGSDLNEGSIENVHGRRMLSLENTYNIDEVKEWYNKMPNEIIVEEKVDGGSCAIRFKNGKIIKALTRGDGIKGEDITQNVRLLNLNISDKFSGEVRGELVMTKKGFEKLNSNNEYQNARNLLSGSMKLLDPEEFKKRAFAIKFIAYWNEELPKNTHYDNIQDLCSYGFDIIKQYKCSDISEIEKAINDIELSKDSLEYEIDGAVMKVNDCSKWPGIGETAKYPRWAKAYKYKQEQVETEVLKIEYEVGMSGKITPVCWFKPVFVDGSTIEKATLNNKEFLEDMDIGIGDKILVQKAACIIPQIIKVIDRTNRSSETKFPDVCPCCGTKLVKHNDEQVDWYCDNDNCKAKIIDKIINYTHAIECDGFAEAIVEKLYDNGLLKSIPDLYTLKDHIEKISNLERLSNKMAEKLCTNISNTKSTEFWKVLSGLAIPGVGSKMAKVLAGKFNSIDELQNAKLHDLTNIEGIAEITAENIISWLDDNKDLIQSLKDSGVNLSQIKKEIKKSNIFGKTFCITGALSKPRKEIEELIETNGGKNVGSVSSKTDYLITNTPNSGSSKNVKAKECGTVIITESEFMKMI